MRRYLSQVLISALLLLSPITFSTDNIPDFKPACDIEASHSKTAAITIAAVRQTYVVLLTSFRADQTDDFLSSRSTPPDCVQVSSCGRSPPVLLSLPS